MTYEFAVTEFKYRVLYLAEFLSQFEDLAASDWPESPAWDDFMKLTMDGDGAFDLEPADHMLAMILENIEQNY